MQTSGSGGAGGAATRQLRRVNDAIEAGGWWRQFGAVALLRLTPVVPFRCARDPCFCPCMCREVCTWWRERRAGLRVDEDMGRVVRFESCELPSKTRCCMHCKVRVVHCLQHTPLRPLVGLQVGLCIPAQAAGTPFVSSQHTLTRQCSSDQHCAHTGIVSQNRNTHE